MIRQKLRVAKMAELAKRSKKTGIFHVALFGLAAYLSPLRLTHPDFWKIFFAVFVLGAGVRTVWCIPSVQKKYFTKIWYPVFYGLTVLIFGAWSLWLTINYHALGMEPSTYFCSLILAGILSGAVMSLAPGRAIMYTVILITIVPPTLALILLGETQASVMAAMFGLNGVFLLSLSRQVNRDYFTGVVNREHAEQNHKMVEGVLHAVPGMVSCVDHHLNYVWTNRKLDERFGINVSGRVKTLGAYSPSDEFPEAVRKFIKSGKSVDQMEFQMTFPDGPRWMMVYLSSYEEYGDGRVLIVAYDIQDKKDGEKELEKQRLVALESAKLATLGEMSAGIAHEINNPLAVMMGRADMMASDLKKGVVDVAALMNNLEKITKSSERIAKIVKGLKAFSRNGEKDAFQSSKVEGMLQDVLDFSREKFKMNSIELKTEISPDLAIECRSTQIEQVLLNLLSNSFDAIAGSPDPWILVKADAEKDFAVISITDSGKGIDPKQVSKIMQPFYTTKEVGKGTGLGLSISLGIIKSHHGEFFYDEKSPHTRFVIRLPLRQAAAV